MAFNSFPGLDKKTSAVGFGAWGIGGATPDGTSYGALSEKEGIACIDAALNAGMRFFDTSPAYGCGNSEIRLGKVLRGKRKDVIIATKGGLYEYAKGQDFSVPALTAGLNASLERLGTHHVDIFQLHNPPADLLDDTEELVAFFDDLKKRGKTTAIGISVKNPTDAFPLLSRYPFDTIQVNLNMMDVRAHECGLLDHCVQNNIAVLARTPLCFGFLSLAINENTVFSPEDHRSFWPREQLALWTAGADEAQAIAKRHDSCEATAADRALRFCLLHPAVKTVLSGPMTKKEAVANAVAGQMPPLDKECLADILSLNKRRSFITRR